MGNIYYVKGDATDNIGGNIAHICNNRGAWGAGFVLALSARWPEPEASYRRLFPLPAWEQEDLLGTVEAVRISDGTQVLNMFAQDGFPSAKRRRAVNYAALGECFSRMVDPFDEEAIHMPRIGCGIGGGDWSIVEELLEYHFVNHGDSYIYVYDYEGTP